MGLQDKLKSYNEAALVRALKAELSEYCTHWKRLDDAHRYELESVLRDDLDAVRARSRNMTTKGQIKEGRQLRSAAQKTRDSNLVNGIRLWCQGAWLEIEGRDIEELNSLQSMIEGAAFNGVNSIHVYAGEFAKKQGEDDGRVSDDELAAKDPGESIEAADQFIEHAGAENLDTLMQVLEKDSRAKPVDTKVIGLLVGVYEVVFGESITQNRERASERLTEIARLLNLPIEYDIFVSMVFANEESGRSEGSPFTKGRNAAKERCKKYAPLKHLDRNDSRL